MFILRAAESNWLNWILLLWEVSNPSGSVVSTLFWWQNQPKKTFFFFLAILDHFQTKTFKSETEKIVSISVNQILLYDWLVPMTLNCNIAKGGCLWYFITVISDWLWCTIPSNSNSAFKAVLPICPIATLNIFLFVC